MEIVKTEIVGYEGLLVDDRKHIEKFINVNLPKSFKRQQESQPRSQDFLPF